MGDLQNLKLILLVFRKWLKINLGKNTFSGINTTQDLIIRLALILECKVSS